MAILWFLSCLVLLSGTYGQSCEVPLGDENSAPKSSSPHKPWFILEKDYGTVSNGHYIISSKSKRYLRDGHLGDMAEKYAEYLDTFEEEFTFFQRIYWLINHSQVPKAISTYRDGNSSTNITVIELSNPFSDEHAEKISIDFDNAGFHKDKCSTMKSYETSKATQDPQWMTVPILTNDECENNWGIRNQGNKICTSLSSCTVKAGSPLVCEQNGAKILAGFVSSFCSKAEPAMFSHMSAFRAWMEKIIQDN